jgi:hypothetical protein
MKMILKYLLGGIVVAGAIIAVSDTLFGFRWYGLERFLFVIGGLIGAIIGGLRR